MTMTNSLAATCSGTGRMLIAAILLIATPALAETWQPAEGSSVSFRATQQRATFEGRFEEFSATIEFDPAAPEDGRIEAAIQLASVDTDYRERDEYLLESDWFHVARFPVARYIADEIAATADGFVARGTLTLRGVSRPVDLGFSFERDGDTAHLRGSADLLRLQFDIGDGEWADTNWVGNEVVVEVDLRLVPAATSASPSADPSRN